MRKFFLVIICSLASYLMAAQESPRDSLMRIIDSGKRDTTMVAALNNLSRLELSEENIVKSRSIALEAADLAVQIDFLEGKAYALKNLGMGYYYEGNYLEVLSYWSQSLETFEQAGDTLGIANMVNNLGAVYYSQGSNTKAIENYLRSLRISEQLGDTLRIATALANIGGVYGDSPKDYDKAISYYQRIQPYLSSLNDPRISIAYEFGIGEILYKQDKVTEALRYYEDALNITTDTPFLSENYTMLGKIHWKLGDRTKSLEYLDKAYSIAKNANDQLQVLKSLIAKGHVYKGFSTKQALATFQEAQELAEAMQTDYELRDVYKGLSETYAARQDFQNAYLLQSRYLQINDALFNLETDDKIRGLQFDFDLQKKQDEVDLLAQQAELTELRANRQKWVMYGTIMGLVIVLILGLGLFSRLRYVRRTNKIIETEKNRSQNLLLNILPEETAAELMENGKVAAKKFDKVTVMFTDFKGFTSTSEDLSPEILVKSVDYYFSRFDAIIDKYGLEKIKTIGDSYMCAGGLHSAPGDHTENMVAAAMEIIAVMKDKRIGRDKDIKKFDIRVGIHRGPVVAGVVGTNKFAYDIWGDTVNVASRMESMSETGKINVSEQVYQHIKSKFDCTYRGEVKVKNRGKLKMYFVDGIRKKEYKKAVEVPSEVVPGSGITQP